MSNIFFLKKSKSHARYATFDSMTPDEVLHDWLNSARQPSRNFYGSEAQLKPEKRHFVVYNNVHGDILQ